MEQSADHYFKIAAKKLQEANEELFRNGNDSVDKKLVCQNAHMAIENYLKGFLAFHETSPTNNSIAQLFEQCVAIDIHLQKIEMKNVICKHNDALFLKCEEIEAITACFEAADNIDTYFRRINILN
ncbi:MAG: HEPN domain-containing protein [Flavobacteriaceae bacterium]|nr:HEPN domain-containing protein [Flavobacteriaceae bacterium]